MKKTIAVLMVLILLLGTAMPVLADTTENTAVAQMDIQFKCGCSRIGTGTMVAKNGFITCAHNLICYEHSKGLKSCVFYFGRNKQKYAYRYNGNFTYYYFTDFKNGYDSSDDIGYVVFPKNVGQHTGWYASTAESDEDLRWEYSNIAGYYGFNRRYDFEQIEVYSSKEICWPISSGLKQCGQGGPVYFWESGEKYPTIRAVYTTTGDHGKKGFARRITNSVIEDMRKNGVLFSQK